MQLIDQVASDENIEQAFSWLCLKRKEHSPNNDVWNLRRHWQTIKPNLQQQLLDGTYQFSPQQEIRFETDTIELWASLDALVLKAVTLVLTQHLKPHTSSVFMSKGMVVARRQSVILQSNLKTTVLYSVLILKVITPVLIIMR